MPLLVVGISVLLLLSAFRFPLMTKAKLTGLGSFGPRRPTGSRDT
ncbi:hypothetical protein [Streptomyces clavuligerus]|nr:hypothetical protein [Streptomyces clavuligerus]